MKKGKINYLVIILLAVLVGIILLLGVAYPADRPIDWVTRGAALMGYFCIFSAIVTSATLRQMKRWFGRPFLKIHHGLSIAGLALVTLHPLTLAWQALSLRVFIPATDSWRSFLTLGGRPAWYLLVIGSLVAVVRGTIGKSWRLLHGLNYLAFLLATVHAMLIGSSVQGWVMRVVCGAMALIVLGILVQKRITSRRQK